MFVMPSRIPPALPLFCIYSWRQKTVDIFNLNRHYFRAQLWFFPLRLSLPLLLSLSSLLWGLVNLANGCHRKRVTLSFFLLSKVCFVSFLTPLLPSLDIGATVFLLKRWFSSVWHILSCFTRLFHFLLSVEMKEARRRRKKNKGDECLDALISNSANETEKFQALGFTHQSTL